MGKQRKTKTDAAKKKTEKDIVALCSEDSFPASDPPSWTGVIAKPGDKESIQQEKK